MFSVYVGTADKYEFVDIKATNCIVVAHITKDGISIISWEVREPFDLLPTFLLVNFKRKFHNFVYFTSDFHEICT